MTTHRLAFASELDTSAGELWEIVGTMKGVNDELGPWLRMSAPAEAARLRIEDAPIGETLFSSWVLLGGVVPIDRHAMRLVEVNRGQSFHEDSVSWSERRWEHRRSIDAIDAHRARLTDRLTFTPRIEASGPVLIRVVGAVFRHRHRRLRQRFGGTDVTALSS
jgi:hypothetical protein